MDVHFHPQPSHTFSQLIIGIANGLLIPFPSFSSDRNTTPLLAQPLCWNSDQGGIDISSPASLLCPQEVIMEQTTGNQDTLRTRWSQGLTASGKTTWEFTVEITGDGSDADAQLDELDRLTFRLEQKGQALSERSQNG